MKHDPILMQNFQELYKPDTWFARNDKHAACSLAGENFTLASTRFPAYRRTMRSLVTPSEEGELYAIYDTYEAVPPVSAPEAPASFLRVFTHVFRSVEEARQGFFYLLWGACRLKSRAEGVLDVGQVSYGRHKYLCFLRNNIVIRILNASPGTEGVPADFAREADRQVVENSR